MNKTYITGKDAALEDSIARLQGALADRGFNIIEHTWANPAPNVWWVHIRDADCPACFTNGKGATKKAALASALGEYIERLSCNYFFADFYWGKELAAGEFVHYPNEKWFPVSEVVIRENCPEGLLDTRLQAHYDPEGELRLSDLVDINSSHAERGVCAIPFVRQSDQETVYIPVNIIGNLYVSNGMSAGNSVTEARTQALSEVFERWVKNTIIAEGIALPQIPDEVLSRFPPIVAAIDALKSEGYLIHAFDASLGGQFPVICVTLLNPDDGGCFASFGAHPSFEVALERTVTELLQGRSIKEMDIFSPPSFDDELVADTHNLETHFIDSSGLVSWDLYHADTDYAFVDWDFTDTTENECEQLMRLINSLGHDIYIADYDFLGVYACRVIVPAMSEIYPVEELTQYNNNVGNAMREVILSLPNANLQDAEQFEYVLDWLDECGVDDSELVRQVLGIAPENGVDNPNPWSDVRLGELRCFLLLALGEHEGALDMVDWVMTFGRSTMPRSRQRFFACLQEQLQLRFDMERVATDYEWIHRELYGDEVYESVQSHIEQTASFYDLPVSDSRLLDFVAHQRLLAAYQKSQTAKCTAVWT